MSCHRWKEENYERVCIVFVLTWDLEVLNDILREDGETWEGYITDFSEVSTIRDDPTGTYYNHVEMQKN